MEPLGWLSIILGAFSIHAVFKGRVMEIPTDLKDLLVSVASGDVAGATAVLQRGSSRFVILTPDTSGTVTAASPGTGLGASAEQLGSAAKGYRLSGVGPDYYDCSGLVWQAAKRIGLSVGLRFTTFTFGVTARNTFEQVSAPVADDVVIWPTHHMGVVTGADQFYSARSVARGIGFSTISGTAKEFGSAPQYWRAKAPLKAE